MKLSLTFAVATSLLTNLACGSRVSGGTDGSTHFWDTCAKDSECGSNVECICGRCTTECIDDEQCSQSGTVCAPASSRLDCSRDDSICVPGDEPSPNGNDASVDASVSPADDLSTVDGGAQTPSDTVSDGNPVISDVSTSNPTGPGPNPSAPDLDAGTWFTGRCLDTQNCPWTSLTSAPFEYASLTAAHDSKLYVFNGGYRVPIVDAGQMSSTEEENPTELLSGNFVYDVATNQWSTLAPPPEGLWASDAEVIGDKIYLVSADGLAIYDIEDDAWSLGAAPPEGLTGVGTRAVGGLLYVFGGYLPFPEGLSTDGVSEVNLTTYIYAPATNTWNTVADAPAAALASASCVLNDRLFVFGEPNWEGNESAPPGVTLIYDTTLDTWTTGAPQQTFGYDQSCVTIGDDLYLLGGYPTSGTWIESVIRYSPATDTWSNVSTLPGLTVWPAQSIGDAVYVLGAFGQDDPSASFWRFTPQL